MKNYSCLNFRIIKMHFLNNRKDLNTTSNPFDIRRQKNLRAIILVEVEVRDAVWLVWCRCSCFCCRTAQVRRSPSACPWCSPSTLTCSLWPTTSPTPANTTPTSATTTSCASSSLPPPSFRWVGHTSHPTWSASRCPTSSDENEIKYNKTYWRWY